MKLLLHNNMYYLYLITRQYLTCDELPDPAFVCKCIQQEFTSATGKISSRLLIPAFDYSAFTTCIVEKKTCTDFLFAKRLLESRLDHSILFDPVFRYIVIGANLGEKEDEQPLVESYSPFSCESRLLDASDYVGFTHDAFQPSFLMNIENIFFSDTLDRRHPYRRLKTFHWKYSDGQSVLYRYAVRPRDGLLGYDLTKVRNDLESKRILQHSENGCIFALYGEVEDFVLECLEKDCFYLLDDRSRARVQNSKECFLPDHNFY